jgi:hypothetical protein
MVEFARGAIYGSPADAAGQEGEYLTNEVGTRTVRATRPSRITFFDSNAGYGKRT